MNHQTTTRLLLFTTHHFDYSLLVAICLRMLSQRLVALLTTACQGSAREGKFLACLKPAK